jgi:hypothetical protein
LKTNEWVKIQLGFFHKEVDQALVGLIAGLELKPKGSQNWAELLGHADSVLGSVPDLGSDPVPDLCFSSGSGSDLSDPLPAASFPGLLVLGNPLGSKELLLHLELGAATAILGDKASDFTSESPDHTAIKSIHAGDPLFDPLSAGVLVAEAEEVSDPSMQMLSSDTIVDFCLSKSQKWLLASLWEAVQDDVTQLALLKDMEESWRQARKFVRCCPLRRTGTWRL